MWQEILIIVIALVVAVFTGYKMYRLFSKKSSPCDHCPGCSIKEKPKQND